MVAPSGYTPFDSAWGRFPIKSVGCNTQRTWRCIVSTFHAVQILKTRLSTLAEALDEGFDHELFNEYLATERQLREETLLLAG